MSRSVVILGGGVAGLAAALAHHDRGWRVHLIEARNQLGGRAWSRQKSPDSPELDNGPHVILGCYHSFRRLLRSIGSEDRFHQAPALNLSWLSKGGRIQRLSPPALPAPFHLAMGLLGISGLGLGEKLSLLRTAVLPFLPGPGSSESLDDWMQRKRVRGASRSLLLTPLCRAILNVEPQEASAGLFLSTLREAFSGSRKNSALWAPTAAWSEILDAPARAYFDRVGIQVSLRSRALALEMRDERSPAIRLLGGTCLPSQDRVVLALPWDSCHGLLSRAGLGQAAQPSWGKDIQPAPILTVYLELPDGILPFDDAVMGLVDGSPFHFLIRRANAMGKAQAGEPTGMLAGAAFGLDGMPAREIIRIALDQLSEWLGRTQPWPEAIQQSARVIRESSATIRATPDAAQHRPKPGPGPTQGLMICGDWTDTGLPSTLEGAARSGYALPVEDDS